MFKNCFVLLEALTFAVCVFCMPKYWIWLQDSER